jgi:hypothetical protein
VLIRLTNGNGLLASKQNAGGKTVKFRKTNNQTKKKGKSWPQNLRMNKHNFICKFVQQAGAKAAGATGS